MSKAGDGSGTVTSMTNGIPDGTINCGNPCSANFTENTQVQMTATPGTHNVFNGWSRACTGTSACAVTIDEARTVTATFAQIEYSLTITPAGGSRALAWHNWLESRSGQSLMQESGCLPLATQM